MNTHRGLTLLELLMAMIISAMVAGAIAGMLGAVSSGVGTRKDNREIMVLAHGAQCRLSAYVNTARCVLGNDGVNLTLWQDDSRESGTVHASEIRWLRFDALAGAVTVQYVSFPTTWTEVAKELADNEYPANADWETVRAYYSGKNLLASRTLIDHISSVAIQSDQKVASNARHIAMDLTFQNAQTSIVVEASGTIQEHQVPVK